MPGGLPLDDLRVVDCGQVISGPICATFLADLGAEVIKVERPSGEAYRINRRELNGEPFNPPFELYNRNKRSICLDLKTSGGQEIIEQMIGDADVFIQNWPPGVAERLNLDYDRCRGLNEDIIYAHVSGYGETGPGSRRPAMDTVVQHLSGFSSLLGFEGDPPIRSQSSIADFFAGYNATISVLGALRHRDRGGTGQKIDISMLDSMMHNMDAAFEYYLNLGEEPPQGGKNAFFNPEMLYGAAEASDGWVCVALVLYNDRVWDGFCDLLDRPDLREDPRYSSDAHRMEDAEELSALLERWLESQTVEEAVEKLNDAGIPAAPHLSISAAAELEQVSHRGTFTNVDHPRFGSLTLTESPLSMSDTEVETRSGAPVLGSDTRAVLEEMGYSSEKILAFFDDNVVFEAG